MMDEVQTKEIMSVSHTLSSKSDDEVQTKEIMSVSHTLSSKSDDGGSPNKGDYVSESYTIVKIR